MPPKTWPKKSRTFTANYIRAIIATKRHYGISSASSFEFLKRKALYAELRKQILRKVPHCPLNAQELENFISAISPLIFVLLNTAEIERELAGKFMLFGRYHCVAAPSLEVLKERVEDEEYYRMWAIDFVALMPELIGLLGKRPSYGNIDRVIRALGNARKNFLVHLGSGKRFSFHAVKEEIRNRKNRKQACYRACKGILLPPQLLAASPVFLEACIRMRDDVKMANLELAEQIDQKFSDVTQQFSCLGRMPMEEYELLHEDQYGEAAPSDRSIRESTRGAMETDKQIAYSHLLLAWERFHAGLTKKEDFTHEEKFALVFDTVVKKLFTTYEATEMEDREQKRDLLYAIRILQKNRGWLKDRLRFKEGEPVRQKASGPERKPLKKSPGSKRKRKGKGRKRSILAKKAPSKPSKSRRT